MTGQQIAEMFWGVLRQNGFQVMDGDWNTTADRLKQAWNEFGAAVTLSFTKANVGDDAIGEVLAWPEDQRQRLYQLLNSLGHRIR